MFVNGYRRLGAVCSQSKWLQLNKVFKKGFNCGAGVVIRGRDLQDRGRYGRE